MLVLTLTGCIQAKLLKYSAFHDHEFSPRAKPAEIQERTTAELLAGGYLLIGYLDLRRNIRTCYVEGGCVSYAGKDDAPQKDELQKEAALKGGDVVTLLEERALVERNDKSVCTSMSVMTTMVNNVPVTTTYCNGYRTIPGKLEARVSRALVWRHEPAAALGEANARAIEEAFKVLDEAQEADGKGGSRQVLSSQNLLKDVAPKQPEMDDETLSRTIERAIEHNERLTLTALADDGRLNVWHDDKGRSPLMVALMRRQADGARTLLSLAHNRSWRDKDGLTALDYAVATADVAFVKEMVAAGHDLRSHNGYGESPLFFSLVNSNEAVFEWLITQGLRATETDKREETTLMFAAEVGRARFIPRLLALGLDINAREVDGRTALMMAARGARADAVKALLAAKADTGATDKHAMTVLHYAAGIGDKEVMQLLLQSDAEREALNDTGVTPLILALYTEKWEAAEMLAASGAALTTPQASYARIATMLVAKRQLGFLQRYLSASPKLVEAFKTDPEWLLHAARTSSAEIIKLIVARGSPVNRPGRDGVTPLMAAASAGNEETLRALLALKADTRPHDVHGQTALQLATVSGHAATASILRGSDMHQ